jgi:hypothetical protein
MSSELRVDTIKLANGNTATASGLGIDIGSTGKIAQLVNVSTTTQRTTTSTTFTAVSDMSISITPSATNSKIYLSAMQTMGVSATGGYWSRVSIFRNGSNLNATSDGMGSMRTNTGDTIITIPMIFVDSPNSTSTQTYQIYFRSPNGVTVYYNYESGSTATFQAMEVLA